LGHSPSGCRAEVSDSGLRMGPLKACFGWMRGIGVGTEFGCRRLGVFPLQSKPS
jgi:hypothetical protein